MFEDDFFSDRDFVTGTGGDSLNSIVGALMVIARVEGRARLILRFNFRRSVSKLTFVSKCNVYIARVAFIAFSRACIACNLLIHGFARIACKTSFIRARAIISCHDVTHVMHVMYIACFEFILLMFARAFN
jgi:hypothetical protein